MNGHILQIIYRVLVFLVFGMVGFLCLTLFLIARLYEKKTGVKTWGPVFIVSIVLGFSTMIIYAFSPEIGPINPLADIIDAVSSGLLLVFGWHLYKKMTEVK